MRRQKLIRNNQVKEENNGKEGKTSNNSKEYGISSISKLKTTGQHQKHVGQKQSFITCSNVYAISLAIVGKCILVRQEKLWFCVKEQQRCNKVNMKKSAVVEYWNICEEFILGDRCIHKSNNNYQTITK